MIDLRAFRRILYNIFYNRELTLNSKDNTAILDKYRYDRVSRGFDTKIRDGNILNAPLHILITMVRVELLSQDSGNFDTGDTHYLLNTDNFSEKTKSVYDYINRIDDWKYFEAFVQISRDIQTEKLFKHEL